MKPTLADKFKAVYEEINITKIVVIIFSVFTLVSYLEYGHKIDTLNKENESLRTRIDNIEYTCADMRQVDTLILTMSEINAKDMEAFQEYQTVYYERLLGVERGLQDINDELDSYD